MATNPNAGTSRTRDIATRYPVEEGLTAGTQTQTGRQTNLIPEEGSNVLRSEKVGLDD